MYMYLLSPAPSSQLRYDGYETAASSLAHTISSYPPTSPSSRLSHLVQLGLQTEGEGGTGGGGGGLCIHTVHVYCTLYTYTCACTCTCMYKCTCTCTGIHARFSKYIPKLFLMYITVLCIHGIICHVLLYLSCTCTCMQLHAR